MSFQSIRAAQAAGFSLVDITADLSAPASLTTAGFTSTIVPTSGVAKLSFSINSTQAGVATIARYADAAGNLSLGNSATTFSANTTANVELSDKLFQAFRLTLTNTGTAAATPTLCCLLSL